MKLGLKPTLAANCVSPWNLENSTCNSLTHEPTLPNSNLYTENKQGNSNKRLLFHVLCYIN